MVSCVFCNIIRGEIPGKFIYQDDEIVAIKDINPKAPVHILVMPRAHMGSLKDVQEGDQPVLGKLLLRVHKLAEEMEIAGDGFKVIINNGHDAGQIIFHLHLHLLGGWKKRPMWNI